MKVKDLIAILSDIPLEADIYLERKELAVSDFTVEPVTESCNDPTIMAYLIVPKQLELDFSKEVN